MSHLKAIHIKRRQLGYDQDDETWRDLVERVTGQRSTRGLSPKASAALLAELDRLMGNKTPRAATRPKGLSGPYAKKLQALWISCWNMALVNVRDNDALNAFARHQAKVGHVNWVRDHRDAVAVIEALKKMLERRGVDWTDGPNDQAYERAPGYKIARAQFTIVKNNERAAGSFRAKVHELCDQQVEDMTNLDWITVMNTFGVEIRKLRDQGAFD